MLIATAGALPSSSVAKLVERLVGTEGAVTVMSCLEVPREFLEELATETWQPFSDEPRTPAIEQAVAQYVEERGIRLVEPIVAALSAGGVDVRALFVEGTDPARAIVDTAVEHEADVIVLGATRPIFDADAWESVSVRVMQQTKVPLLLVPGASRAGRDGREEQLAEDGVDA